jgi:hypothetical protein
MSLEGRRSPSAWPGHAKKGADGGRGDSVTERVGRAHMEGDAVASSGQGRPCAACANCKVHSGEVLGLFWLSRLCWTVRVSKGGGVGGR